MKKISELSEIREELKNEKSNLNSKIEEMRHERMGLNDQLMVQKLEQERE